MQLVGKKDYLEALALFHNRANRMKLLALAEGRIEAEVFSDGPGPSVAAVSYMNKLLIASPLEAESLAEKLKPLLAERVYGNGDGNGETMLFWDGTHAREAILSALGGKSPAHALREYWELENPAGAKPAATPEGYELKPVDRALLDMGHANTGRLTEEMCSERASVEAFLAESFGVAAVKEGELAGWCLSEYNCAAGCEVGIEVVEGHRRKGLALAMVSAFAREAARRGAGRIGWHCFKSNLASSATAKSAGFTKALEYGELLCFQNDSLQYAVNGNFSDAFGRFEEAADWYARAIAGHDAPLWVHMRFAMALTSLGRVDEAFSALECGIRRGFNSWGWLRAEQRLEPLRFEDRWKQLF